MTGGLLTGTVVLKHYLASDLIANGGQSDVYHGVDQRNCQQVVIKQLVVCEADQHFDRELARFRRAAQLTIGHPRVVDPIDFGEQDGEHFIIFPHVDGSDLGEYVRVQGGKLAVAQAIQILWDLAEALAALDACGIVHRDLKPRNVIVQPDGHAVLIDLGICRLRHQATLSRKTRGFGSPPWIPPEQEADARAADHRSDIYALGLLTRFALTGCEPNPNATPSCPVRYTSLRQADPAIPELLDRLCLQMLDPRPEARPQTARDILQILSHGAPAAVGAACLNCGAGFTTGAKYCTQCGAPCNPQAQSQVYCLACGSPLSDTSVCSRCRSTFGTAGHHLRFMAGHLGGRVYLIPELILQVGREQLDPQNHYISRRQFLLSAQNGTVLLQDSGGANKTLVAGQPAIRPVALQPGQEVNVAGYIAVYGCQFS